MKEKDRWIRPFKNIQHQWNGVKSENGAGKFSFPSKYVKIRGGPCITARAAEI